jgi:hypothetical protein
MSSSCSNTQRISALIFLTIYLPSRVPRNSIQLLSKLLNKNSLLYRSMPIRLPAPLARGPSEANNETSGGKAPKRTLSNSEMTVTRSFRHEIPNHPLHGSTLFSTHPVAMSHDGKTTRPSNRGSVSVMALATELVAA